MESLKTLLIANRGEIAVRITKTAKYAMFPLETTYLESTNLISAGNSAYALLPFIQQLMQLPSMSPLQTLLFFSGKIPTYI